MFNLFFIEVVPDLSTNVNERYLCNVSNISDPIEKLYKNKKLSEYLDHQKDGICGRYK